MESNPNHNSDGGNRPASVIALLLTLVIILITLFLYYRSHSNLRKTVLGYGRIALAPPLNESFLQRGPNRYINEVIDGDLNRPGVVSFPGKPPEGSYFLVELGLSHWPPQPGEKPLRRTPAELLLYNGPCSDCSTDEFTQYSRIKKARIDLYRRQANNPDREYRHEPTIHLKTLYHTLLDQSGSQSILLPLSEAPPSEGYPSQIYLIIAKITVLEIYPGEESSEVALAEIIYGDLDAQEALQPGPTIHHWQ